MTGNITSALILSALAGLSTTIGSVLGISVKKVSPRFMSSSLGFAAGVMLYISFVELLARATGTVGLGMAQVAFFVGMMAMFAVDLVIPHEYMAEKAKVKGAVVDIKRTGVFVALGVAIHNFPEGMATFAGALESTKIGVAIALAIAIHNIPEGFAISAPIFAATGSRAKAFFYSFLSGVSEPVGAVIAALVLYPVLSPAVLAYMMAFVAGLMVFISLDELVPASRVYGFDHIAILMVILGMAVMGGSLLLLG